MQCEAEAFFIVGKIQSHQFRLRFKPHGMVKKPHFFSLPLKLENIPAFMPAFCKSVSRFLAAVWTPLKKKPPHFRCCAFL
jgi:hypothetical protein